jgi:hypothetical protein
MSEPKGYWQISDSSVVLDLTFALKIRGDTEAKLKSTTLATPSLADFGADATRINR